MNEASWKAFQIQTVGMFNWWTFDLCEIIRITWIVTFFLRLWRLQMSVRALILSWIRTHGRSWPVTPRARAGWTPEAVFASGPSVIIHSSPDTTLIHIESDICRVRHTRSWQKCETQHLCCINACFMKCQEEFSRVIMRLGYTVVSHFILSAEGKTDAITFKSLLSLIYFYTLE